MEELKQNDVILRSLKEIGRKCTAREVYNHIIDHRYYEFKTRVQQKGTPEYTVNSRLQELAKSQDSKVRRLELKKPYLYYLADDINYWLFQGNPRYYNFELAIKDGVLDNWGVKHYKNEIKEGDKAILWITGSMGGVAGIAEITSKPTQGAEVKDRYCWKEGNSSNPDDYSVFLKIESDISFFSNPLTVNKDVLGLSVGAGYQNTNYRANEQQYLTIKSLMYEQLMDDIVFEKLGEYSEGNVIFQLQKIRARNRDVLQIAKNRFKEKHGKLFCEACGFDFENVYGELGKDFIEGHHIVPVSSMKENHKTKPEDILMLCANCHRMVHRKIQTLSLSELKLVLNNK